MPRITRARERPCQYPGCPKTFESDGSSSRKYCDDHKGGPRTVDAKGTLKMYTRVCATPGCDNTFESTNFTRQHCDDHYGSRAKRRKPGPAARNLTTEELVDQEREKQRQKELLRELTQLQRTEAKRREYLASIHDVLAPFQPTPLLPLRAGEDYKPEHYWLLEFSDWHTGQYTPIQATGGVYEQTTEITRWQVETMLNALRSIHRVQIGGQSIRKVLVVFNGDLHEHDSMRAAQARKIDRLVTQQAVEVFDLMAYVLRQLLSFPGIEEIEAHNVGGNHDRTSSKPGLAGLGELDYVDTYSWLIGSLLERALAEEPRIVLKNWETYFGYTQFAGQKIIFEHGSSTRYSSGSYGGVPWYPIINSANKLVEMLGGGDLVLNGHIHRPAVLPIGQAAWLVINGALPATTEYVQSTFKAVRTPTQWLTNIHREHGVIEFHPLYAPPASLRPPGAIWTLTD